MTYEIGFFSPEDATWIPLDSFNRRDVAEVFMKKIQFYTSAKIEIHEYNEEECHADVD